MRSEDLMATMLPEHLWGASLHEMPSMVRDGLERYISHLDTAIANGDGVIVFGRPDVSGDAIAILLKAACHSGVQCRYVAASQLSTGNERELCRKVDLLAIDLDVPCEAILFERVVRHRHDHRLPTMIAARQDVVAMSKTYGKSVMSVIKGSMFPVMA